VFLNRNSRQLLFLNGYSLKAKKLMEHRRRVERKREEKELAAKKERAKKAREAAQKAREVIKCC